MNRGYMKNTVIKTIALMAIFNLMLDTNTHAMKNLYDIKKIILDFFTLRTNTSAIQIEEKDPSPYGNKTANLSELKTLFCEKKFLESLSSFCGQNNIQTTIKVPKFTGISHDKIANLLKALGFDIQEEWNKIVPDKEQQESIIKDKKLTTKFIKKLDGLGQKIKKLKAPINDKTLPNDITLFIEKAKQNNWRLMVRSTGKEDSLEVANAGGNKTKLNVPANNTDVFKAIISVVASYISLKSISQRLDAGDKTIFNTPFTPVLLQRMIGEPLNGAKDSKEIPACGVIYTAEPNGEYKDLTVIQASYGLNDGVVNSIVPTDTYYTESNGTIFPVISKKTFRLIPTQKEDKSYGFAKQENPKEMSNAPALDKKQIALVDFVSRKIYDHYFEPTDIEFVFDRAQNTLYIVQARPIQKARQQKNPSYFVKPESFDPKHLVFGDTANVASGAVLFLNKNKTIIAKTLEDALKIYIPMPDKSAIKAVIVKNNVEPTSHAAAVFRGADIAIMKTSEIEKISNWLKGSDIAIDVQQGLIVKNSTINPINQNLVAKGWVTYPINEQISINQDVCSNHGGYYGQPDISSSNTLENFIYTLKTTTDSSKYIEALDSVKLLVINQARSLYSQAYTFTDWEKNSIINNEIDNTCSTIFNALHTKPMSIERLWPIKRLEAMLFQKNSPHIINAWSIRSILTNHEKKQTFIKDILNPLKIDKLLIDNEPFVLLAMKGYDLASTNEFGKQWISFVADVFKNNKQKDLETLVESLEQLDVLPSWINVCFAEAVKDNKNDCLKTLLSEFESSKKEVKNCIQLLQTIKSFNISGWEKPKKFASLLETTKKDVLANVTKKDLLARLDKDSKMSQLTRLITTQVLKTAVDFFDVSIKAIKGSTLYPDPKTDPKALKVSHVAELVKLFYTMFETFFNHLVDQKLIIEVGPENTAYSESLTPSEYTDWLQKHVKNFSSEKNASTLNPSPVFNGAAATFSARTLFAERHNPGFLEDVFTLIHQNHLSCIMLWLKNAINTNIVNKPELVRNLQKGKIIGNNSLETYFSGIKISRDGMTSTYNVPLRNHSVECKITFKKDYIEFTQYFLGQNMQEHNDRWKIISDFTKILSPLNNTKIIEEKISNLGFEQKRIISTDTNITAFFEELKNHISHAILYAKPYNLSKYFSSENFIKNVPIHILISSISQNITIPWAIDCFKTITEKTPDLIKGPHISTLITAIAHNITDNNAVDCFGCIVKKYSNFIKDTHIDPLITAIANNITNTLAIDCFDCIVKKYSTFIKGTHTDTLIASIANKITNKNAVKCFTFIAEKTPGLINDSHIHTLITIIANNIMSYYAVDCFKCISKKYPNFVKDTHIDVLITKIANNITDPYVIDCFRHSAKISPTRIKKLHIDMLITSITKNIRDDNAVNCFEDITNNTTLKEKVLKKHVFELMNAIIKKANSEETQPLRCFEIIIKYPEFVTYIQECDDAKIKNFLSKNKPKN